MARQKKPDRLARWAMEAQTAGVSYGQYVAENHPTLTMGGEDLQPKTRKQVESEHKSSGHQHYMVAVIGRNIDTGEELFFESLHSVNQAGFNSTSVSNCVNGRQTVHRGYTWRRAVRDPRHNDYNPIMALNPETGECLHFDSMAEAEMAGFDKKYIRMCLNGQRGSHHGFIWQKDDQEEDP